MMRMGKYMIILILLGNMLFQGGNVQASSYYNNVDDARSQAEQMLNRMTPEERVGQLMLVTFQGVDTSSMSQIYDLVVNRHVGGVILRSENNNIPSQENVNQFLYSLSSSLQSIRYDAARLGVVDPQTGKAFQPQYIPLFIGLVQEGDGYPTDQILGGLTQMPSQMAIGATWQPEMALQAGTVLGTELQTVGINLLLGPSLDVLDSPRTEGGLDLGIRTFGGDPFWVSEMAKAYISGVHQGGRNRIVVVAKHFPGYGGSDRLPGEEVATVRKSLEQLKQIELAPFFSVCGNLSERDHLTDALMVSHIRYQGFQGNIRATTRPVSFDASALAQLTDLPLISDWREQGGLLISDDLGSRAVRRFYDPAEKVFDARQVTRNAFLAGNDMLYMGNMRSSNDPDSYSSIIQTLDSFSQKYREDPSFAARVDASVLTILILKYRLYPSFELQSIIPNAMFLNQIGDSTQTVFAILHEAATLISPDEQNTAINLPNPPTVSENLVLFTSSLIGKQCPSCNDLSVFPYDGLEKAILKNYGPPNASQVRSERLSSYSFKDLTAFLSNAVAPENLENDISQADWVIFSMLDVSSQNPETEALRTLLANHYDLVRNKKVIVFAFSAPYFLDATDISKITAYYGIYSKVPSALDVAARILFHELTPEGAAPVSITGTGYDLIQVTAPDPDQIIPLTLDFPNQESASSTGTPEATVIPVFRVGDKLQLMTGVIIDQNGNPVPDGTTVRFIITRTGDTTSSQQVDAESMRGIASGQFVIDTTGLYEIRAISEPAMISQILQLNVTHETGAMVTEIAPTAEPQSTVFNEESVFSATQVPFEEDSHDALPFGAWFIALLMLLIEAISGYILVTRAWKITRWGIRAAMLVLIFGWMAYLYLAFGLPGSEKLSVFNTLLIILLSGGIGIVVMLCWRWILKLKEMIFS
jgi:beta-N-acetylhexosaminidase